MPVLAPSYTQRPFLLFNGHLESIVPFLREKTEPHLYDRERLELNDGDFVDLDWIRTGSTRLMILSHGIEGNAQSYYVKDAAQYFAARNWDILAWNFRGCSGEPNRSHKRYHMGETDDLDAVIRHAISLQYKEVILMGYSVGGSMTLKYLGEKAVPEEVRAAVTFSVPCDILDCIKVSEKFSNRLYVKKITSKLRSRLLSHTNPYPNLTASDINQMRSLRQFHEKVILPLYGFQNMESYNRSASCKNHLHSIQIPTFLGNALNDPLLGEACYPVEQARNNPYFHLELPRKGGHLGFSQNGDNWMNVRAEEFLDRFSIYENADQLSSPTM